MIKIIQCDIITKFIRIQFNLGLLQYKTFQKKKEIAILDFKNWSRKYESNKDLFF